MVTCPRSQKYQVEEASEGPVFFPPFHHLLLRVMLPSCPPCPGLARSPAAHGQRAPPLPLPQVPAHPSLIPALSRFLSGGRCVCVVRPERPQQQGMTSVGRGRSRTGTGRGSPERGCTWSCRLFLWTQAPAMPPLGKGKCKGKDALKGEGQPPSICLPWEI